MLKHDATPMIGKSRLNKGGNKSVIMLVSLSLSFPMLVAQHHL
ncbi:hypothetical protein VII00023_20247 [Vibrio ichthyoenteri ATCC 700023]|uniref:Uncharacterized protein n=1 Tax=Vibrio ichthyoenteri ATCC 700023 TaxID=870968 RepID=F9RXN2_9VIBR|nr:hypothetical protein VII00023_20247 [Vibrio ichthyoenteri ATCC 700023]